MTYVIVKDMPKRNFSAQLADYAINHNNALSSMEQFIVMWGDSW